MIVKICGITNREDALAAVEAGASAIGFNFYPGSPRCIRPDLAAGIGEGLDILKVGVFVDESPASIEETARIAGLDIAQLHGTEHPHRLPSMRIWKAFRVTPEWEPASLNAYPAEAFLLDGPAPGTGTGFDWSRARGLKHHIILAGGLAPENVAAAIRAVEPWGVDACSRLERATGIKDHTKVRRFIEAARNYAP
jgi:phosphoribosylanthranilate isomerase